MHQKIGSHIYLPRNVSLWPANGSSPLILRRLVHVEDSVKAWTQKNITRIYKIFAIIMINHKWHTVYVIIFPPCYFHPSSLANGFACWHWGLKGQIFSCLQYCIMLRYISVKKRLTDFWCLTVVTISILKGLICEQKYLQQKDYYTSCKSFSIRFWKFVYSISLFTFIVNYTCTSCPLTTQYFMLCEIYTMKLTQGWQNQSLGLALDM